MAHRSSESEPTGDFHNDADVEAFIRKFGYADKNDKPNSLRSAGRHHRIALTDSLERLPKPTFVRAWCAIAYLHPGLHPDGCEGADSGWPRVLRRFAAEAWRRAEAGELAEEELHPSDAQWCGLYDQMTNPTPDETERRRELAALCESVETMKV